MRKFLVMMLIGLTASAFAQSLSLEELCEREVKRRIDKMNTDDLYSYDDTYIEVIDKVEVNGEIYAEYEARTYLDGPYDGVARTDYGVTYSVKKGFCEIGEIEVIAEYDIAD